MGTYINVGNANLKMALNSEIFVDKSLILQKICGLINTNNRFICVSRPRRFGKTSVRDLMSAYFSKGCDSFSLFENLKIAEPPKVEKKAKKAGAKPEKPFDFKENLNKFNVLSLDMGFFYNVSEDKNNVMETLRNELLEDFQKEFKEIEFNDSDSIAKMIQRVYDATNTQFIVLVDEYDTLIREKVSAEMIEKYRELLNSLFKSEPLSKAIALAYLTGILPVIRDRVQSKLNNFKESTMLSPFGLEEFFGFTKNEVKALCKEYRMSFKECERWYDGYKIGKIDIYNPNSVVEAMMQREYDNYWQKTGSYEAVSDYIDIDFDGIKSDITEMIAGKEIKVDVGKFENSLDKLNTKDNIFTYLIHLGYLNYDRNTKLCRIPNMEIRMEWEKAVESAGNFSELVKMIKDSEELLELVQEGDSEKVAAALDKAHSEVSSLKNYNNEASLQAAIILAFYAAREKYTIIQELPAGKGFADIGFVPLSKKEPAMIVELKCDQNADTALKQIKNKNYPKVFEKYLGNLFLVGINYDKETKVHECVIEKY